MGIVDGAMIIDAEKRQSVQSGDFKSKSFHIKEENMRFIASLLRNNYSDPMMATMREYVCNAIDASPDGEKILVTLPTRLDQNFYVRDFGDGLSEEEMFDLFTSYGESTKRGSNEKIGAFGIGKVSALSYVDSFMIVSYYNGVKTTYTMRINDEDDTNLVKLFSEATNESSGLMIQVPIPQDDISFFVDKFSHFFYFLKDKIDISNGNFAEFVFQDKNEVYSLVKDSYISYPAYGMRILNSSHIEMGGILYPVNDDDIDEYPAFFINGMIYHAEMGEFKIHHSRETLEYNDKTKANLKKASDKIIEKMSESFSDKISNLKTLWDASVFINDVEKFVDNAFAYNRHAISISRNAKNDLLEKIVDTSKIPEFNGQVASKYLFNVGRVKAYSISLLSDDKISMNKLSNSYQDILRPSDDKHFIINDSPEPRSVRNRISNFDFGDAKKIYYFDVCGPEVIERAKAFDRHNITLLSQMPRRPIVRKKKVASNGPRIPKDDILSFISGGSRGNNSEFWQNAEIEDIDNGTYYYVRCYMNMPMYVDKEHRVFDTLYNMGQFTTFLDMDVYGVKNKAIDKIKNKPNWIPFEKVFEEKMLESPIVQNSFKLYAISTKLIEDYDIPCSPHFGSKIFLDERFGYLNNLNSIASNFFELMEEYAEIYSNQRFNIPRIHRNDCHDMGFTAYLTNPSFDKEMKIIDDFFEKYPMITYALSNPRHSEDIYSVCAEYIKRW